MVELGRRLVTLRGPACASVRAHIGAAVVGLNHPVRIIGIDPQPVIVAMRNADRPEGLSTIVGAVHACVENVDTIHGAGIGKNMRVVKGPLAVAAVIIHQCPVLASIIGAEQSAFVRFDQRPDAVPISISDRHANPADSAAGQPVRFQSLPGRAAVS